MGIAAGQWVWAAWCASLIAAFLAGILAARLILRTHRSPRLSLLIEAGIIAAAATGTLGLAAVPVLAAAMAMQNEAVTHGAVTVNVAFITGDIQRLGERLVAETMPGQPRKREGQRRLILAILVFYALGAAAGTLCSRWGAPALILPAAVLAGGALLPKRWTGLAAQRQ
jgi:uncharacterized membrane protein YoaK (UPF0700 family)